MKIEKLLSEIEDHVRELFRDFNQPYLLYHNIHHTSQVVEHAAEIANHYAVDNNSRFVLLAAAWFHDTGYLVGEAFGHEEKGAELMKQFLSTRQIDEKIIEEVSLCIMATRIPSQPVTLLEKIICDADTYHLGTDDFQTTNALVWREVELTRHTTVDNQAGHALHFLEAHRYYTTYCQEVLSEGKNRNIAWLKAQVKTN